MAASVPSESLQVNGRQDLIVLSAVCFYFPVFKYIRITFSHSSEDRFMR